MRSLTFLSGKEMHCLTCSAQNCFSRTFNLLIMNIQKLFGPVHAKCNKLKQNSAFSHLRGPHRVTVFLPLVYFIANPEGMCLAWTWITPGPVPRTAEPAGEYLACSRSCGILSLPPNCCSGGTGFPALKRGSQALVEVGNTRSDFCSWAWTCSILIKSQLPYINKFM